VTSRVFTEDEQQIRAIRDTVVPDLSDCTLSTALLALSKLVADYLEAELQARSPPCTHRYRGIVREREVARRKKRWLEARTKLEAVTACLPPKKARP
jgi:hypothetical protein